MSNGQMTHDRVAMAKGSSSVSLTHREAEVAQLISLGYRHKEVASMLDITTGGVGVHVGNIASRIPGAATPTVKVTLWWLEYRA